EKPPEPDLGELERGTAEGEHTDERAEETHVDKASQTELEEEIDRRIDLVLEEAAEEGEEDTLLELEEEGRKPDSLEETEDLESLAEQIVQGGTGEVGSQGEESLREEVETLIEEGVPGDGDGEVEPEFTAQDGGIDEPGREGEGASEPVWLETPGKSEGSIAGDSVTDSGDVEELALEDLESLGETMEEIEELPVDKELEELLGEGEGGAFEGVGTEGDREGEEEPGASELAVGLAEEDRQEEGVFQERSDLERQEEGGFDEGGAETVTEILVTEGAGAETPEELEEQLFEEELEEEGGEILEEPLEGPAASFASQGQLIKEDVTEEEVDEFQRQLSSDFEDSEPKVAPVEGKPDERIESLVRRTVEQIFSGISDRVIPELTKSIVRVASERIEEVIQQVVPELAENAIKKEIERLQKEG
ncbi:MAG: hypothetical protein JRH07_06380, partial [Deltaproteobacteria bacterium]|nr:hypothetical protein [Deltaproteobacteria bacterium]